MNKEDTLKKIIGLDEENLELSEKSISQEIARLSDELDQTVKSKYLYANECTNVAEQLYDLAMKIKELNLKKQQLEIWNVNKKYLSQE